MTNKNKKKRPSRLERIESKCEIILAELAIIRKSIQPRQADVDEAIERMHRNARAMRAEAERDLKLLRNVFQCK